MFFVYGETHPVSRCHVRQLALSVISTPPLERLRRKQALPLDSVYCLQPTPPSWALPNGIIPICQEKPRIAKPIPIRYVVLSSEFQHLVNLLQDLRLAHTGVRVWIGNEVGEVR